MFFFFCSVSRTLNQLSAHGQVSVKLVLHVQHDTFFLISSCTVSFQLQFLGICSSDLISSEDVWLVLTKGRYPDPDLKKCKDRQRCTYVETANGKIMGKQFVLFSCAEIHQEDENQATPSHQHLNQRKHVPVCFFFLSPLAYAIKSSAWRTWFSLRPGDLWPCVNWKLPCESKQSHK